MCVNCVVWACTMRIPGAARAPTSSAPTSFAEVQDECSACVVLWPIQRCGHGLRDAGDVQQAARDDCPSLYRVVLRVLAAPSVRLLRFGRDP